MRQQQSCEDSLATLLQVDVVHTEKEKSLGMGVVKGQTGPAGTLRELILFQIEEGSL